MFAMPEPTGVGHKSSFYLEGRERRISTTPGVHRIPPLREVFSYCALRVTRYNIYSRWDRADSKKEKISGRAKNQIKLQPIFVRYQFVFNPWNDNYLSC